jgi:hypothetical protein
VEIRLIGGLRGLGELGGYPALLAADAPPEKPAAMPGSDVHLRSAAEIRRNEGTKPRPETSRPDLAG